MEQLLLLAANGEFTSVPESLTSLYAADFDLRRLDTQLKMLPDFIKIAMDGSVKRVTSIRTICEALNKSPIGKKMLSEVAKLLRIYLTIPVTTATAERSFSVLRRLKTWLRNTMTQERMNNLLLLHVHKTITDALDLREIAEKFATVNEQRQNFFGSFKA